MLEQTLIANCGGNCGQAGARGFIDDVIQSRETRRRICRSLAMLEDMKLDNPWRKHGNIPL